MKKTALVAAVSAAILASGAQADVTKATLYPHGGVLTWEESREIQEGTGILRISGLPVSLEDHSLQAGLEGAPGAEIQRVSVVREELADTVSKELAAVRVRQRQVETQIQKHKNEANLWEQQLKLVSQVAQNPGDEITPDNLIGLSDKMLEISKRSYKELESIQIALAELEKEKDLLDRKAAQMTAGAKATKAVEIAYRASGQGEANISLSFRTPSVGWRSEYDARLNSTTGAIAVEHKAAIRQQSGIDWSDVELSLATTNQNLGTTIPPVHAWEVYRRTPDNEHTRAFEALNAAPEMSMSARSNMKSMAAFDAAPQAELVNDGSKSQSYRVSGTVSLPNQSSDQSVLVAKHDMDSDLKTHFYPAMTDKGYVVAHATYNGDATLSSARVTLYRDGQMIGPWMLPEMAPGDEVEIGFGADDRVSLKTATKEDERGESGVYDKENYWKRQRVHTVTNHYKTPAAVRVIERLPVSRHEEITVSYYGMTRPYIENLDAKEGIIAWDRVIEAGGSIDLSAGFELEVPSDQEI